VVRASGAGEAGYSPPLPRASADEAGHPARGRQGISRQHGTRRQCTIGDLGTGSSERAEMKRPPALVRAEGDRPAL